MTVTQWCLEFWYSFAAWNLCFIICVCVAWILYLTWMHVKCSLQFNDFPLFYIYTYIYLYLFILLLLLFNEWLNEPLWVYGNAKNGFTFASRYNKNKYMEKKKEDMQWKASSGALVKRWRRQLLFPRWHCMREYERILFLVHDNRTPSKRETSSLLAFDK